MYEENMKEKRKGKGSTSHQAELFIKSAIKNKTILYLFENGIGQKGKYTHYGIFNGKIESSDKDIYNNITIKQPGIWKEEFQYAFYVHKWIPLNRSQQLNVYNTINPKGKSRRKTIQKINNYLYGTDLKVKSPKILKKYKFPTVILRAGPYNSEIKKNILKFINKKTTFI